MTSIPAVTLNNGVEMPQFGFGVLGEQFLRSTRGSYTRPCRSATSKASGVLRWHLQQGRVVIAKSVTPARIRENLDVFGFTLNVEDLEAIDALERDGRTGPHPASFHG